MKKQLVIIPILFAALILLSGCGGGGETVRVKDGMLTMGKTTLDFGGNAVADGAAALSVEKNVGAEKENGLVSELYALELNEDCDQPVAVSLPVPNDAPTADAVMLESAWIT